MHINLRQLVIIMDQSAKMIKSEFMKHGMDLYEFCIL